MYSYDDRPRAVQLYIKLGKRAGLTIRQLGYPTKNALRAWHRAYEQRHDLPVASMRAPKYSPTQRKLAVDHCDANGRCLALTIKALGYPSRSLLADWIRKAHPEQRPRVGHAQEPRSSQAKQSAVMALCLRRGSAQAVAHELGVSRPSLYHWRNQLLTTEALAFMKPQQDPSPAPERDALEHELERLQRDVKRLQLEQDIVKQANELLKKELGIDQQLLLLPPGEARAWRQVRRRSRSHGRHLRAQRPLLRLAPDARHALQAVGDHLRDGCPALDEARALGPGRAHAQALWLIHGRDQSGTGQSLEP